MKLFLNDAESPFARCLIEAAHERGYLVVAARQQAADDSKLPSVNGGDKSRQSAQAPQILPWNPASIFSIRLVLRQCQFLWGHEEHTESAEQLGNYLFLLQSSMISASLFRDKLHEVHQKIEEQLYGQLVLLRELENQRAKFTGKIQNNSRIVFVVLEENHPVELLGGSIYSALRYSFHHILSNSNDPETLGFYSQSNSYEAFSEFILSHLDRPSDKHAGKWIKFRRFGLSSNLASGFKRSKHRK